MTQLHVRSTGSIKTFPSCAIGFDLSRHSLDAAHLCRSSAISSAGKMAIVGASKNERLPGDCQIGVDDAFAMSGKFGSG